MNNSWIIHNSWFIVQTYLQLAGVDWPQLSTARPWELSTDHPRLVQLLCNDSRPSSHRPLLTLFAMHTVDLSPPKWRSRPRQCRIHAVDSYLRGGDRNGDQEQTSFIPSLPMSADWANGVQFMSSFHNSYSVIQWVSQRVGLGMPRPVFPSTWRSNF